MNTIREFAKNVGHEVIGKLTRIAEKETEQDRSKFYMDEAGNEYWIGKKGICIVTADGGVI